MKWENLPENIKNIRLKDCYYSISTCIEQAVDAAKDFEDAKLNIRDWMESIINEAEYIMDKFGVNKEGTKNEHSKS